MFAQYLHQTRISLKIICFHVAQTKASQTMGHVPVETVTFSILIAEEFIFNFTNIILINLLYSSKGHKTKSLRNSGNLSDIFACLFHYKSYNSVVSELTFSFYLRSMCRSRVQGEKVLKSLHLFLFILLFIVIHVTVRCIYIYFILINHFGFLIVLKIKNKNRMFLSWWCFAITKQFIKFRKCKKIKN